MANVTQDTAFVHGRLLILASSLLKNLEFEPSPHLLRTCFGYGFDFRRAA
jgi:hypothetical protein